MNKYLSVYGFYFRFFAFILLFSGCATSRKAERANKAAKETQEKEIKEKYASKLGVSPADISDYHLYAFIDQWYGTPYHYAGHSKQGVDCSDFTCILYRNVFDKDVKGTAESLYEQCKHVSQDHLQEGDLVFFRINGKHVTHVGVYLQNNKFVHASIHSGVVIDDLNESYYKKYFYKGGRLN